jgi:NAD-dependent deacetylase
MSIEKQEDILKIEQAVGLFSNSSRIVFLTGAGFSTPSGIPDFRSAGSGLWTKFLPMEVASLSTFRYDPEKFFAWLHPLASHMLNAEPNPAHYALSKLEEAGRLEAIITQNIDGLHHRAGSKKVFEIHGTFNSLTCVSCFNKFPAQGLIEPYLQEGTIPTCPSCRRILKPDVILFEEQLPLRPWMDAQEAARSCDLMVIAGTSLEVMPSSVLPVRALDNGAHLIMINKTETYIDVRADVILQQDVADVIPKIVRAVLGE